MKMRHFFILLCLVLIVGLGFQIFYFRTENARLKAEIVSYDEADRTSLLVKSRKSIETKDLQSSITPPVPSSSVEESPADDRANMRRRIFNDLREVGENPAINEMMVAQQRGLIDHLYAPLTELFNFSPEEKEYFEDLLSTRQVALMNFSIETMGGLTVERRKEIQNEIQDLKKEALESMQYFLNDDNDYSAFMDYEDSLLERMDINAFASTLGESGLQVDPVTMEEMINIAYSMRKEMSFSMNPDPRILQSPEHFTEERIQKFSEELSWYNERVASAVASRMSPEELKVFRSTQEQMRKLKISNLRMTASMLSK